MDSITFLDDLKQNAFLLLFVNFILKLFWCYYVVDWGRWVKTGLE